MKKERKRKALAATVCGSMLAIALVGGTLAYLSDTDSDVNVMTLGNVSIEQIEQERVDTTNLPTAENNLKAFTQAKPLYPAVFDGASIKWNNDSVDNQAWKVVESNANVIDKFVTVKNTGKSAAYVRTLIAYEGNETYGPKGDYIHVVHNSDNVNPAIEVNCVGVVRVNDADYTVYEYVYPEALAAGETSIPSLKQVYMNKAADNDVVAKYGDTYEILVLSQAVQTNGFADAQTALDTAFGYPEAPNDSGVMNVVAWFSGDEFEIPTAVATADELSDALAAGKSVYLTGDVTLTEGITFPKNEAATLNLNGHSITGTASAPMSFITNNGDLTIEGEGKIAVTFSGTVDNSTAMNAISNRGNLTVNGGEITNTGIGDQIGYAIDNYNGAKLVVNGGKIDASGSIYYDGIRLFCGSDETIVTVNGGNISTIWAQNPSANKAAAVKGTVVLNGGNVTTTYYENYTTVKVAKGVSATVSAYGAGSGNTTSTTQADYTVYSFVH